VRTGIIGGCAQVPPAYDPREDNRLRGSKTDEARKREPDKPTPARTHLEKRNALLHRLIGAAEGGIGKGACRGGDFEGVSERTIEMGVGDGTDSPERKIAVGTRREKRGK